MRFTRALAVVGLCCVCITSLLDGCASTPPYSPQTYVVRPRDTLYSIAWRHDVDFRELAKWNNIGPDYRLAVGQILLLQPGPSSSDKRAASTSPRGPPPTSSRAPNGSHVGNRKPQAAAPGGAAASTAVAGAGGRAAGGGAAMTGGNPAGGAAAGGGAAAVAGAAGGDAAGGAAGGGATGGAAVAAARTGVVSKWLWPTEHYAPPRPVPGGGILLFGKLGQDVRAAGTGRVLYTGSGIRGYGNLIIVKHADNLLSSYAHNSEMLVHEGQEVVMGQIIAHMGVAEHQTSALYFEIRLNGKPVDPLRYLPAAQ